MSKAHTMGSTVESKQNSLLSTPTFDIEIPGYEIIKQCGDGGTAKVFIATQKSLDRQVALKIMLSALAVDEDHSTRFLKEGRVIAKLTHPNIVTIYDVGVSDNNHYIAMEYLPSGSLREKFSNKLELSEILKIVEQIASALAYAHENGFVHRDIKPENILFRKDDVAVLSDFGIAKVVDTRTQITNRGSLGTPRYMSPDQIRSNPIGPSSDVYSLGVVLYEMLTGQPPYDSDDSVSILYSHVHESIPALPLDSRHLQPLINKMLAKETKYRLTDAGEVLTVLRYLIKEGRLPKELIHSTSGSIPINQPTILVDQKTIDEVVSGNKSVGQESQITKSLANKKNHTIPVTSDELAEAISTQARIEEYKNNSNSFIKRVVDSVSSSTKALNNKVNKVPTILPKPKLNLKTNSKSAKYLLYQDSGIERVVKIVLHPILLGVAGIIAAFSLFVAYNINETNEETQQQMHVSNIEDTMKTTKNEPVITKPIEVNDSSIKNADIVVKDETQVIDSPISKTEKIQTWLSEAESLIEKGQYISPARENALSKYQQILSLEPGNEQALVGLQSIVNRYTEQAKLAGFGGVFAANPQNLSGEKDTVIQLANFNQNQNTGIELEKTNSDSSSAKKIIIESENEPNKKQDKDKTVQEVVEVKTDDKSLLINDKESKLSAEKESEPTSINVALTEQKPSKNKNEISKNKIKELIALADAYIEKDYLTFPIGENALEVYQHIRQIDPNHPSIEKGFERIADHYALAAERRFANGDIERAITLVRRGLRVQSNHEWLQQLEEELAPYGY